MGAVHGIQTPEGTDLSTVEAVLDYVRANGGRSTPSRRTLLEVLFGGRGHRSAEELADEVRALHPDVHLSTVYRNLDEFERLGVVTHTHLGHGPVTYQLAWRSHAHFICECCGSRTDVPDTLFRGMARSAKKALGFEVDPRHSAILGRCASCLESEGSN